MYREPFSSFILLMRVDLIVTTFKRTYHHFVIVEYVECVWFRLFQPIEIGIYSVSILRYRFFFDTYPRAFFSARSCKVHPVRLSGQEGGCHHLCHECATSIIYACKSTAFSLFSRWSDALFCARPRLASRRGAAVAGVVLSESGIGRTASGRREKRRFPAIATDCVPTPCGRPGKTLRSARISSAERGIFLCGENPRAPRRKKLFSAEKIQRNRTR